MADNPVTGPDGKPVDDRILESPGAPFFGSSPPIQAGIKRGSVWAVVGTFCTLMADLLVLNNGLELPAYVHSFVPLATMMFFAIGAAIDRNSVKDDEPTVRAARTLALRKRLRLNRDSE